MNKKTGIELIAQEREEQKTKHGHTVETDVEHNKDCDLAVLATTLAYTPWDGNPYILVSLANPAWKNPTVKKMFDKPYKERVVIAAALLAAELDRLQAMEEAENGGE